VNGYPYHKHEVPSPAVAYLAKQVGVPTEQYVQYPWSGRTIEYHRAQIRTLLGWREATEQDAVDLGEWLCAQVLPQERDLDHLKVAVAARCRVLQIEPPTAGQIDRLVRSALRTHEELFCATLLQRLTPPLCARLDALLQAPSAPSPETASAQPLPDAPPCEEATGSGHPEPGRPPWHDVKADPGPATLDSVIDEVATLHRLRVLDLPPDLFAHVPAKVLQTYRRRAAAEDVHELRRHPAALRATLLSAFCWVRQQEVTDSLIDLLLAMVHRIGMTAERRVEHELRDDLKRVTGKTNLLFQVAEVALDHPDGLVKEVLYPVIGEQTLRDLVKEYRATGPAYRRHIHLVMRNSYRAHYRRMLPHLLDAVEFRSNNAVHRPVIRALALLKEYATSKQRYYAATADVPIDGVIRPGWRAIIVEKDGDGAERVNRINYEICVLQALRDKLRCREIWVVGAGRFGDPENDLPADFEAQRVTYYETLKLPLAADTFIADLQKEMIGALSTLDRDMVTNPDVKILSKAGGWIALSPLLAQPEPLHLATLKAEVGHRWPMSSLLDFLKETDLRVGFTGQFKSPTVWETLEPSTLQRRLLLCLYGLGTNTGLKRMSDESQGDAYKDLLYVRRRFLHRDALRGAIAQVVNAIFQTRQPHIWGEGTTACASDSKKFGAWDQNLMTEYSPRHHGNGVMIYWHVERKAVCIYSQLKTCSSSEVATMIEGVLRHCTEMTVEKTYVDSHGQSEVAFAFTRLLGFELLPRLKGMHFQKLYRPEVGCPEAYPHLQPVLTRPIDWDLIRQQYDLYVSCNWGQHHRPAHIRVLRSRASGADPAVAARPRVLWAA